MGCEWRARLRQAKRRGVPVVVVDPRRTETAKQLGTQWLPVRPGTDSALMLAVLHVLVAEGLIDEPFIAAHATGFEALRRRVLGRRRRRGHHAGVGRADLRHAGCRHRRAGAGSTARRKPAALLPGLSIQRAWGGEEPVRLAIALQVATGNLGRLRRVVRRAELGRPARIRRRPPPCAAQSGGLDDDPRQRLGRRRAASAAPAATRTSTPLYNVGGNYVCQGADVGQERARPAVPRLLRVSRPLPDGHGSAVRRRAAGHALAGAQRHRVHARELRAVLAQGGRAARRVAQRLRHPRRRGRAAGLAGTRSRRARTRTPGCASSWRVRRSPTTTSSGAPASTSGAIRSASASPPSPPTRRRTRWARRPARWS